MAIKDIKLLKRIPSTFGEGPKIGLIENPDGSKVYSAIIDFAIDEPYAFNQFVQLLDTATDKDTFHISIKSPGGNLNTGLFVTDAMERSSAKIITHALHIAASCGAMLWAYGEERHAYPLSRPMFHTASMGARGRTRDIMDNAAECEATILEFMEHPRVMQVITTAELKKCVTNKTDLYLNSKDLEGRPGVKVHPSKPGKPIDDNVPDIEHKQVRAKTEEETD